MIQPRASWPRSSSAMWWGRQGYDVNMFCMSLMKAENRAEFKTNEAEYLKKFSKVQLSAVGTKSSICSEAAG